MFNKLTKLFVTITLLYQTPVYSKSASFNEFNSKDLSNYFSGIIASENNNNSDALKFFNASKDLLKKHKSYLKRYTYSLVLENKILGNNNTPLVVDHPYASVDIDIEEDFNFAEYIIKNYPDE